MDLGYTQLHYKYWGEGSPTVVLDVGFNDNYRDWVSLLDKISTKTSVFAYDRAGYGESTFSRYPRDSKTIAFELNQLLKKADVKPPYILLGHSLGAMNLQVFANEHPNDIAAIVLIDPPPISWVKGDSFPDLLDMAHSLTFQYSKNASDDDIDPESRERFKTLASEHQEMFISSMEQVDKINNFKDIPLIVINSDIPNPAFGESAEDFQNLWVNDSKALTEKSSMGHFVLVENSTHMVHKDKPEIILNQIEKILK